MEFKEKFDEVKKILKRNVEIGRELVARRQDPERVLKPPKAVPYVRRLRAAMQQTEHAVRKSRRRLWCSQCFGFSPSKGSKIPWLSLECEPGQPAHPEAGAPHLTHELEMSAENTIVYCRMCGLWGGTTTASC